MKLPSIAKAERSGESSAPNSARAKTPREEAQEGPYGIRSPNQRSRKAMRSDTASGAVTDRSRTSGGESTDRCVMSSFKIEFQPAPGVRLLLWSLVISLVGLSGSERCY